MGVPDIENSITKNSLWIFQYMCGGSAVSADKAGSTEGTIYSDMVPLWLCKRPSLIEGLTSYISVKCLYPLQVVP